MAKRLPALSLERSTANRKMNKLEQDLLRAIERLEQAVKTLATANPKPDIQALLKDVDSFTEKLPRGTDPNLLHYLHRKSYEKARLWLQGREDENQRGACR